MVIMDILCRMQMAIYLYLMMAGEVQDIGTDIISENR